MVGMIVAADAVVAGGTVVAGETVVAVGVVVTTSLVDVAGGLSTSADDVNTCHGPWRVGNTAWTTQWTTRCTDRVLHTPLGFTRWWDVWGNGRVWRESLRRTNPRREQARLPSGSVAASPGPMTSRWTRMPIDRRSRVPPPGLPTLGR